MSPFRILTEEPAEVLLSRQLQCTDKELIVLIESYSPAAATLISAIRP